MNLFFDIRLAEDYHSLLQKVRVMSENWVEKNIYCVRCGNNLKRLKNNTPISDLYCERCKENFELKSNKNLFTKKIVDGAYSKMIEKIENGNIPNFFYLNYSSVDYRVKNLIVIPSHFFTKEIIIKRPPLSVNAKRAGWVGCNIDVSFIPESGKLFLIRNEKVEDKNTIIEKFNKMLFLQRSTGEFRGWLLDVLKCIELLGMSDFSLKDIYAFEEILRKKHPKNFNIKAKIRQQLQMLRDFGYLSFTKRGNYSLR
ncbi:MAG: hypothetical protein J6B07_02535 [Opitutales bacterium]|nr:hypothetical protein [Opitutales bacterium]